MQKIILITFVQLLYNLNFTFSQDLKKEFEIVIPNSKIHNSCYNSIEFIDSRVDKSKLGFVDIGLLNKRATIVFKTPIQNQVDLLFNSIIDKKALNGKIVFQLKQLYFIEHRYTTSEIGYCNFKAILYSKNEVTYQKIESIDTIIFVRSAIDVTLPLLKSGSDIINEFIWKNLSKESRFPEQYSYNDILNIDSVEKRKILVYNTDKFNDGLYTNYVSFSNQKPDKEIIVNTKKDGTISKVETFNKEQKLIKIKSKNIYAIVYNGKPYIATQYGYYPLVKRNDNFYFTGDINTSNSDKIVAASYYMGLMGALLATTDHSTYLVKIDHNKGKFILEREIVTNF